MLYPLVVSCWAQSSFLLPTALMGLDVKREEVVEAKENLYSLEFYTSKWNLMSALKMLKTKKKAIPSSIWKQKD